jgi:hypothetical protein
VWQYPGIVLFTDTTQNQQISFDGGRSARPAGVSRNSVSSGVQIPVAVSSGAAAATPVTFSVTGVH